MKIAVMADLHLNKTVYKVMDRKNPQLPFRNVDFMNSFEYMVDQCVNAIKPDLLVIGGDVYDKCYFPSNEIRGFFSSQLSKLAIAKIPVIILIGNHDISKKSHALQDIGELKLKNIVVIEKPTITSFKDTQLFIFPYSLDVEQKKKTIKEDFMDFVKEIHAKKNDKPSIFFGHFGVKGATINQYSGDEEIEGEETETKTTTTTIKKDYKNRSVNDISCDDLDSIGADYVILGDYHKHQILPTHKCIAMYPGSIEKTSFSEIDQDKGFVVYDSEQEVKGKMGKCSFIKYPNCRPMLELKGNFMDMKNAFNKVDCKEYQDAVVKFTYTGKSSELIDFQTGEEAFKKEIREKLNPINIDVINKAKDDKQEEATQLEQNIMENGHFSNEDVIDAVREMTKERIKDEKEMQLTIDLADEIYNETIEMVGK